MIEKTDVAVEKMTDTAGGIQRRLRHAVGLTVIQRACAKVTL